MKLYQLYQNRCTAWDNVQWNKPDMERQILLIFPYKWDLKQKINKK